ncbi:MAG: PIN domain nuclease [Dehalococcoidia bacterium]|nr:PIN domain nuclease [Dehalococcoidia bacterium]
MPASAMVSATIGLVVGLVVAALISVPLFNLDGWMSWGVPLAITGVLGSLGLLIGASREQDMRRFFPRDTAEGPYANALTGNILVDTSAIIDGRIADLGQTGFLQGTLVIPGFVLDELRHIADSSNSLRRNRGRRGLEALAKIRKETSVPIQVLDASLLNGTEVDGQLVKLAKAMEAPILTTDFNLNRVAEVHGIRVLNVNELANALKPMVIPGENLTVNIIQEGKEVGQGVAFLDDGTMVVVEGGRRYLNTFRDVTVTRVLQTAAGRIIFAQPRVE